MRTCTGRWPSLTRWMRTTKGSPGRTAAGQRPRTATRPRTRRPAGAHVGAVEARRRRPRRRVATDVASAVEAARGRRVGAASRARPWAPAAASAWRRRRRRRRRGLGGGRRGRGRRRSPAAARAARRARSKPSRASRNVARRVGELALRRERVRRGPALSAAAAKASGRRARPRPRRRARCASSRRAASAWARKTLLRRAESSAAAGWRGSSSSRRDELLRGAPRVSPSSSEPRGPRDRVLQLLQPRPGPASSTRSASAWPGASLQRALAPASRPPRSSCRRARAARAAPASRTSAWVSAPTSGLEALGLGCGLRPGCAAPRQPGDHDQRAARRRARPRDGREAPGDGGRGCGAPRSRPAAGRDRHRRGAGGARAAGAPRQRRRAGERRRRGGRAAAPGIGRRGGGRRPAGRQPAAAAARASRAAGRGRAPAGRAAASAARICRRLAKRLSRSLCSARFTTATSGAGTSGTQRRTGGGCLVDDLEEHARRRLGLEGLVAGQQLVEDRARREQVGAASTLSPSACSGDM